MATNKRKQAKDLGFGRPNLPTPEDVADIAEEGGGVSGDTAADYVAGATTPDTNTDGTITYNTDTPVGPPASAPFSNLNSQEQSNVAQGILRTTVLPTLGTGAAQQYTGLETGDVAGGSQFLDPNDPGTQVGDFGGTVHGTVQRGARTADEQVDIDAAGFDAAQIGDTGTTGAATGDVTREIDPQTGQYRTTQAAQGQVTEADLLTAAQGRVAERIQPAEIDPSTFEADRVAGPTVRQMDTGSIDAATGQAVQTSIDDFRRQADFGGASAGAAVGEAAQQDIQGSLDLMNFQAATTDVQDAINQMGYEGAVVNAVSAGNVGDFLIGQPPEMVAAQMQNVTGEAAKGVAAQIDVDAALANLNDQPAQMQAVVAALPEEALVTSQLDNLLAGLEGGRTPAWAQPAIAQVENMLAARGLGKSSIGRDALFNAIISSAMPLAQSNATALQDRARQNLGYQNRANEINAQMQQQLGMQLNDKVANFVSMNAQLQQDMEKTNMSMAQQMELANLEYEWNTNRENMTAENAARLENIRNTMQIDLANQGAAMNIAQFNAQQQQQANLATGQFAQEAMMGQAGAVGNILGQNVAAQQQTNLAQSGSVGNILSQNAQFQQQMAMGNVSNEQATNILNSQFAQQVGMQNNEAVANFMAQNTQLLQQMETANMSAEQQARMINLETEYKTNKANMDAENVAELEGLRNDLQVELANQAVASNLGLANLNNKQQAAVQNAMNVLNMDMKNLDLKQQEALVNSQFMQSMTMTNLSNRQQTTLQDAASWAAMDTANLSAAMTAQVENARNFLQMDMANLSNEQQTVMLDSQQRFQGMLTDANFEQAARKFGAESQNQINTFRENLVSNIDMFNRESQNQMAQFNVTQRNDMRQFDAQMEFQYDSFGANMYNQISQFNAGWRREMNTIDTAGTNAVMAANAMNAFALQSTSMNMLWQDLMDSKAMAFEAQEGEANRQVTLAASALTAEQNESYMNQQTWAAVGAWVAGLIS